MQPFKRTKRAVPTSIFIGKILLIAISIFLLFLIFRLLIGSARLSSFHADDIIDGFSSKKTLISRINELEDNIAKYNQDSQEATLLQKENEQLKGEMNRSLPPYGTLARVLTAPNRSFYDTMIIDAGSAEGITEGQIAYAFESIALGTVASVDVHRSTVQLFSAPNRETAGTAEGSEVSITLIGRGVGEYEVRMPRDVEFSVGEVISYQSVDTAVLAKIEKIVTDPRDPFQRLLAKAPVNLTTLKFVIVR